MSYCLEDSNFNYVLLTAKAILYELRQKCDIRISPSAQDTFNVTINVYNN
jgi:hypothetical protein